ncbi:protein translocase subunit SecF, partial [Falsihalocynthiibacter sp. S25ZX9]
MRLKLVPSESNWDFFSTTKITLGASALAVVVSVILLFTMGLNFGIDFKGGTTIRTDSDISVDVGAYRDALTPLNLGDVSITEIFDTTNADLNAAQIRIQAKEG